ncbi:SUMF1/EgtB/PvdO family nonheme iron enzyme [Acidobacteriota bacterium]
MLRMNLKNAVTVLACVMICLALTTSPAYSQFGRNTVAKDKAREFYAKGHELYRKGYPREAMKHFELALDYSTHAFGQEIVARDSLGELVKISREIGDFESMVQYIKRKLAILGKKDDLTRLMTYEQLGDGYGKLNNKTEAAKAYQQAIEIAQGFAFKEKTAELKKKFAELDVIVPTAPSTETQPAPQPVTPKVVKQKPSKPAPRPTPKFTPRPTSPPAPTPAPFKPPVPRVTESKVPGMILIPGGVATLGDDNGAPDEKPARQETIQPFYMDAHEVTYVDYAKFEKATGYRAKGPWKKFFQEGHQKHPVRGVTWQDAHAYASWAGKRLPTEAEWEYAARGPQGLRYAYGNDYDASKARTGLSRKDGATAVGSYEPNVFGLYDMTGNVSEWVSDIYNPKPAEADRAPKKGLRVLRGGAFDDGPENALCANRSANRAGMGMYYFGFRCAKDVE